MEAHVPHKLEILIWGFGKADPFTIAVPVTRPAPVDSSTFRVAVEPPATVLEALASSPAATAQSF